MSRRIKRTISSAERDKNARPDRRDGERVKNHRPPKHRGGGKPPRFSERRHESRDESRKSRSSFGTEPPKAKDQSEPQLPRKVQTVAVTADEDNMRVDRF